MADPSPLLTAASSSSTIVTIDPAIRVFRTDGLVVSGDRIEAIGHPADILRDFRHLADEVLDPGDRILLPGFVNTHVHTSQQLAKGIADDVDLVMWLNERIWPYESHMTEEDSYVSTLLCGIELIRSKMVHPMLTRICTLPVQTLGPLQSVLRL